MNRSTLAVLALLAVAMPAAAQQAQPALPPPHVQPALPAPQAQPAKPPTVKPAPTPRPMTGRLHADSDSDPSAPQAFSVVLVLGESQASTIQDNVPAAARKALADMKDFLPYKGYRLLDTQWTLCCGNYPITSRLKGAEDQEYELQLSASMVGAGRVNVRFVLADLAAATDTSTERLALLQRQLEQARSQRAEVARRVDSGLAPATEIQKVDRQMQSLERQLAQAGDTPFKYRPGRGSGIIDTSFRMDVGETVVVGTSRTKGDKALIALLTAVPPKSATTGRD